MTHLQLIHGRLQDAALKITDNFCYGCYKVVEGDHCPDCGTDDFMRHLSGVGVEYGTEWVIAYLLQTRLTPIGEEEKEEMYEDFLDECYPEVKVGEIIYSTSQVIKKLDPLYFQMGASENLQRLAGDGVLYVSTVVNTTERATLKKCSTTSRINKTKNVNLLVKGKKNG